MSKLTHIPKIVRGPDGKERVVYVRTPETDQEMEKFRLGSLAEIKPLVRSQAPELIKNIRAPALVIQAPYLMARQVVRTRLEVDRSPHRILNGMTLFQSHWDSSESCREGFPQFKQLFLVFGYIELTNKIQHQVICETLFTRYELGLHFWLVMPKPLMEMSAQWGSAFDHFQVFPSIRVDSLEGSSAPSEEPSYKPGKLDFTLVSTACPTAPPDASKARKPYVVIDPSYVEDGLEGDFGFGELTKGDVMFQPKKKKNKGSGGAF